MADSGQHYLDAYLEITTLQGESTDKTMTQQIQLRSFSLGFSNSDSGSSDVDKTAKRMEELQQKGKKMSDAERLEMISLGKKLSEFSVKLREWKDQQVKLSSNTVSQRQADLARRYSFKITKDTDASTPLLFKAYFSTSDYTQTLSFPEGNIRVRRTGVTNRSPTPYLLLDFTQLMVIGWKLESESDTVPKETVTFSFKTYKMTYYPQAADGSQGTATGPMGWDFDKNQKT